MTNEEENLLKGYRKLKQLNPTGNFVICDTDSYASFNLQTGKKTILVQEEIEDD